MSAILTIAGWRPLKRMLQADSFEVRGGRGPEDSGISDYLENAHGRVNPLLHVLLFVNRNLKRKSAAGGSSLTTAAVLQLLSHIATLNNTIDKNTTITGNNTTITLLIIIKRIASSTSPLTTSSLHLKRASA